MQKNKYEVRTCAITNQKAHLLLIIKPLVAISSYCLHLSLSNKRLKHILTSLAQSPLYVYRNGGNPKFILFNFIHNNVDDIFKINNETGPKILYKLL